MTGPVVDAECLTTLASACRDQEHVSLRYGYSKAAKSEREVEPHGLVHAGNRWYLAAWDLGREDWRTFRLDRIARCASTHRRFVPWPIPEGSVARYVARSVGVRRYSRLAVANRKSNPRRHVARGDRGEGSSRSDVGLAWRCVSAAAGYTNRDLSRRPSR